MYECPLCHGPLVPLPEITTTVDKSVSPPRIPGDTPGIVITRCGHLFHGRCIQEWFKTHVNAPCPICLTDTLLVERVYPTFASRSESTDDMESKSTPCSHATQNKLTNCKNCNVFRREVELLKTSNQKLKATVDKNAIKKTTKKNLAGQDARIRSVVNDNFHLCERNERLREQIQEIVDENYGHGDEILLFRYKNEDLLKEGETLRLEKKAKNDEHEHLRNENNKLRKENENLRMKNYARNYKNQTPRYEENVNLEAKRNRNFLMRVKDSTERVLVRMTRAVFGCFHKSG